MRKEKITSFQNFLDYIDTIEILGYDINIFRGQADNSKLLPSIARTNQKVDTTKIEIKMLEELKRTSRLLIKEPFQSDWEWLLCLLSILG